MPSRRLPLILSLLALPLLSACGDATPAAPDPLAPEALAAVSPSPGVSRSRLARAVDALFASGESGRTDALLVLRNGKVIAERYGPGVGPQTRINGWALAQSVTGVMVGQLVADGRLRMDETAPIPIWQRPGDPRGEITLRHLLQMRSGLRHSEIAPVAHESDTMRMLFLDGRDDMAGYAEAQPLEAVPGRKFEYSSATGLILADAAARALTDLEDPDNRRRSVNDYLRTRLFEPLGMRSAVAEYDARGTFIGSAMLHATARDWSRFGEFLRHGGSVKGAQLVPRAWVEFMTRPSPRNPAYGAQLWLNQPSSTSEEELFPGKAPANLFASVGQYGQYLIVSPDQRLTVVRLGHTGADEHAALRAQLADIVALVPKD